MSEEFSREDINAAVDKAVVELLDASAVAVPPVDALYLAQQHLGMVLRIDDNKRVGRVRPSASGVIVLPAGLAAEQAQLAVARAIGTFLKPAIMDRLGVPREEQKGLLGTSLAGLFASRLLMPTRWFTPEAARCAFDVPVLQHVFATAPADAVAWRLLDLDEPCVMTIIENAAVLRRRSNAWRVGAALSPAEQECQRHVHESGRPHVVRSRRWTVHGWPCHESDRKREILRSVLEVPE